MDIIERLEDEELYVDAVDDAIAEIKRLRALTANTPVAAFDPICYQLDVYDNLIDVRLEKTRHGNDPLWAIRESGYCLNKDGKWVIEIINSNKDKDFFERCRWSSAEEAISFWVNEKHKSRFEHYRNQEHKWQPLPEPPGQGE